MNFRLKHIRSSARERGFTLLEAVLVIGLTSLIAVGVVAGLLEGLDALGQITDTQSAEFGHQKVMEQFTKDIQSATWFSNGTVTAEGGTQDVNGTTSPFAIVLGYPGQYGEEVWVRYHIRYGTFSGGTYLVRTYATTDGLEGMSILTPGVSNLMFNYFDEAGDFTDVIAEVKKVEMTLSVNMGGTTVQRMYGVVLRNANGGPKVAPMDFDAIETKYFKK
jgi:type II secretory pathway pseudopilin PulG